MCYIIFILNRSYLAITFDNNVWFNLLNILYMVIQCFLYYNMYMIYYTSHVNTFFLQLHILFKFLFIYL